MLGGGKTRVLRCRVVLRDTLIDAMVEPLLPPLSVKINVLGYTVIKMKPLPSHGSKTASVKCTLLPEKKISLTQHSSVFLGAWCRKYHTGDNIAHTPLGLTLKLIFGRRWGESADAERRVYDKIALDEIFPKAAISVGCWEIYRF